MPTFELNWLDLLGFAGFFTLVLSTALYKSRGRQTGEDFFLAARGLTWPLIGLSLIAANISSEQFVGQSGQSAGLMGMAVASYEWIAAITLVVVALVFLPRFLQAGVYTIPEYLEYRYNPLARGIMAVYLLAIYIGVSISAVVYTGALALHTIFGMNLTAAVWLIGALAALYSTWGGLKAIAWADLFQGIGLIAGGALVLGLGLHAIGGFGELVRTNPEKMHTMLPADHPILPWTAMLVGIWIPNLYYWGLNQFIMQRALAARSLKQGQYGILFAGFLKLAMPFLIAVPGIIAAQLYREQLAAPGATADMAYPLLVRDLTPAGLRGIVFAALAGAITSTLASMLNSVSTILTVDLYQRHFRPNAAPETLVRIGRAATVGFVVVVCLIAPSLGAPRFRGIFNYIQEFHGYISPGILAAFVFGVFVKRAPAQAGVAALLLSPAVYGLLQWQAPEIAFLNRQAVTLAVIFAAMAAMTVLRPRQAPLVIPRNEAFDMRSSPAVIGLSALLVALTVALYVVFW